MRRGSAVGMVVLLIALVVVMLLVARSWRELAPSAIELSRPRTGADPRAAHGDADAGGAPDDGLPGLDEARQHTDRHAAEVQDALDATNH
ncbi:MAG TPA: hypothetical protein VD788_16785 [Candidatus Polarisedimenticolaceae bacterium]|nr:hypothetical protein [Candidatus Polarisedimenticolaceae bacterium]